VWALHQAPPARRLFLRAALGIFIVLSPPRFYQGWPFTAFRGPFHRVPMMFCGIAGISLIWEGGMTLSGSAASFLKEKD
jgi:hypothetical protein